MASRPTGATKRRRSGWCLGATVLALGCGGKNEPIGSTREQHDDPPRIDAAPTDDRRDAGTSPMHDAEADDENLAPTRDPNSMRDASAIGSDASTNTPGPLTSAPDEPCLDGVHPTSQLRRLTARQYDRTVRDLLGVRTLAALGVQRPSDWLAPDHPEGLDERDWVGYQSVAKAIAEQVVNDPALLANYVECDLDEDADCLSSTVSRFGRRAFRRPLTGDETESFQRLLAVGAQAPVKELAQVLLETFLISPSFIQRAEVSEAPDSDGQFTLSSYEIASRLSYFLWGTMPDDRLDTLADAGQLGSAAQILAEAQRMLKDDKAIEMVTAFSQNYMGMAADTYWSSVKDADKFPEYTDAVRDAMSAETERFFEHLIFGDGTFEDLFQSRVGFVNAATAPLYGLDPAAFGADLEQVDLAERPGFLTRVGFLSAYSGASRTSPMRRGGFVVNQVLGYDLAPLSSVAAGSVPEVPDLDTNRNRVAAQTAAPDCKVCHDIVNPPGFVLETFDAIGRYQTVEADTGAPIDTAADVVIDRTVTPISGPEALMEALAHSRDARAHYAQLWVNYAYEREQDTPSDGCTVSELTEKLSTDGYTIVELIADLAQTPQFRTRTLESP